MAQQPQLTPAIENTLARYIEIQREQKGLEEEKTKLQQILITHVGPMNASLWTPVIGGEQLRVSYRTTVEVRYDERLLRNRLGERYIHVLALDLKKLKQNLSCAESHLEPIISIVGSPSRAKVRSAIVEGIVSKEEFEGAFEKTTKHQISVGRARP